MKTIYAKITLLLLAVSISASCVHEYPEGDGTNPTNVETTIRLYTVSELTRAMYSPGLGLPYAYFIVEIYKDGYFGIPVFRKTIGVEKSADGSAEIEFTVGLPAGNYKAAAWAVGSETANSPGTIFDSSDLANIGFQGEYSGSTEKKECYEARFDLALANGWNERVRYDEEMRTPMGGVEIISEDIDAFYKIIEQRVDIGKQQKSDLISNEPTRVNAEDLKDYYMRWNYGMYFPTAYNLYTGLPNKADVGVDFLSAINELNRNEASLGFDYIFVNGETSKVTLNLEVYDKRTNELINTYSGIPVPLERGKMTIIRGNFLTVKHDSGVGINPGFSGDIEITIPD